jgi:hypothetical protein
MSMVKYTPNRKAPARLSPGEETRLAAMSDGQAEANAAADPDSRPMSDADWSCGRTRWLVRKARGLLDVIRLTRTADARPPSDVLELTADPRQPPRQATGGGGA